MNFCIMKRIYAFFFISIFVCFFNEIHAQIKIDFKITLFEEESKGVKLIITSSKVKEKNRTANSSGRCTIKLDYNDFYTIKVVKKGYVSKIVEFNTDVTQEIIDQGDDFPKKKIKLTLYPNKKDVDISLCSKAVVKYTYDRDMDDFMRDKRYELAIAPDLKILEDKLKIRDVKTKSLAVVSKKEEKIVKPISKPVVRPVVKSVNKKKVVKEIKAKRFVNSSHNPRKKISHSTSERVYPLYAEKDDRTYIERGTDLNNTQIAMAYEKFDKLIEKARKSYVDNNYALARYYFENALLLVRLEGENLRMYKSIDKKIQEIKEKKASDRFLTLKKKADDFYDKGSFTYSRYFYRLALDIKSNDSLVIKRLQVIKNKLDK